MFALCIFLMYNLFKYTIILILFMQQKSTTINEQGQIVIPKIFRDYLNSKTVLIQKDENHSIKLTPIPDLGGSLAKYTSSKNSDFKQERNQAWESAVKQNFDPKDK